MTKKVPTYKVALSPDGGWSITKGTSSKAIETYSIKGLAVAVAKGLAKDDCGLLYIHGRDGTVRQKWDYSAPKQVKTPNKIIAKRTKKVKVEHMGYKKLDVMGITEDVVQGLKDIDLTDYVVPTYPVEIDSIVVNCGGNPRGSGGVTYPSELEFLQKRLAECLDRNALLHTEIYCLKTKSIWQRIKDVFIYE